MNKIGELAGRYEWRRLVKRHFIVVLVALLLSWTYMGQSMTSCQTTVIGSIGGDNINGIIWLFSNTPHPYGGFSHVTNYPFGESVSQPQLITSAALLTPTWLLAKAVGPVCAWNAMVFFGYMSSALLMYGFIYWLLRKRGIALFAAIAVGFSPYHYWKTWGHLAYIQSEIFVAIIWAYLAFWRRPTKKKAVLLGLLASGLLYGDGYFPLIGGVLIGSLLGYSLIIDYLLSRGQNARRRFYVQKLKYLMISASILFIAFIPIAYVKHHYAAEISADLTHARSDPKIEVETYGTHFIDYVLPSDSSPITPVRHAVDNYRAKHVYSDNGEYGVYLGLATLALAFTAVGVGAYKLIWERGKQRPTNETWLLWVSGAGITVTLAAFMSSLAPSMAIFGIHPEWPSAIISSLVSYWRVFARFYLTVNIGVVTLAAIGLWYITKRLGSRWLRLGFLALVIIVTILELMPVNPFSRTDEWKVTSGSPTYIWLSKQPSIKAVAAYPILESPMGPSYFGDQLVHKKALLNSYVGNDSQLLLHRALTGINDAQTLGVLKTLGINDLLLYRVELPANDSQRLTLLYGNFGARVAAINPSVVPLKHVLVPDSGYARPLVDPTTDISCRQQLGTIGGLGIRRLDGMPASTEPVAVHFDLEGNPGQSEIVFSQGKIYDNYMFSQKNELHPVDLTVPENAPIYVGHVSDPAAGFVSVCNLGIGS